MGRHRWTRGLVVTSLAAAVSSCQPWGAPAGELAMQVQWPMRTLAVPANTAVVAVGVFHDGQLVPNGTYRVGIAGRTAGTILYRGLANGDYRVVAGAFDADARPLAGGAGTGTVRAETGTRAQVRLTLALGDPVSELNPYLDDIRRYLESQRREPSPSPPAPSAAAPNVAPPPPQQPPASSQPAPATTSSPASSGGSSGAGSTSPDSTVTFSGGFL